MEATSHPKQLVARSYDQLGDTYPAWAQGVRKAERQRYTQLILAKAPKEKISR
ncbi:MAG: hypothetical protein R3C14_04530 [Caldilineaceae bacterium]